MVQGLIVGEHFDCYVFQSLNLYRSTTLQGWTTLTSDLSIGPSLSKDKPFMSVKREDVMDHEHVVTVVRGCQNYYHAFVAVKRTSAA